MSEILKRCSKCKGHLPATTFYFHPSSKATDKLQSQCKQCKGGKYDYPRDKLPQARDGYKYCTRCKIEKPATTDYFYRKTRSTDAFFAVCRQCRSEIGGFTYREPARDGYKRCTKCTQEKPATTEFFHRQTAAQSGLNPWCKDCVRRQHKVDEERIKQRYLMNREKIQIRQRLYYRQNRERYRAQHRLYYEKNKDRIYKYILGWRNENPEKVKEYARRTQKRCRERKRAYLQRWRQSNPERARAQTRKRRAIARQAAGNHDAHDVIVQYGRQRGRCYYCNCKVGKKYDVDHVVPLSRGGSNGPENIVIACPSCNRSKSDKLPHEWDGSGRLL